MAKLDDLYTLDDNLKSLSGPTRINPGGNKGLAYVCFSGKIFVH